MILIQLVLKFIKDFLAKYWKEIVVTILIALIIKIIYDKGYSSAYSDRTSYYEEILKSEHDNLVKKIDNLETLSSQQTLAIIGNQKQLGIDLNKITLDIKDKKMYIVKNGECIPSQDFIDTYNAVIYRANSK